MVTRGVLLDMAAHYGTDVVKEGTAFNTKEIEEVAKKQGVEIRQGDVVLFHTGWLSLIGKDDKRFGAGEPGLGVEGAKYLTSKASSQSAQTPGALRQSRSRPRTFSRCTRSCCR
jgi:kynurenine formamidase